MITATVVLVGFVAYELRSSDPMMELRLFRSPPYTAAILTAFAVLFCGYGALLVTTQYFQNIDQYSAAETGLLLLAFSLPNMAVAPVAGRLSARFGGRQPTLAGVALVGVGSAVLAYGARGALWLTVVGLALLGTGIGMAVATSTAGVQLPTSTLVDARTDAGRERVVRGSETRIRHIRALARCHGQRACRSRAPAGEVRPERTVAVHGDGAGRELTQRLVVVRCASLCTLQSIRGA